MGVDVRAKSNFTIQKETKCAKNVIGRINVQKRVCWHRFHVRLENIKRGKNKHFVLTVMIEKDATKLSYLGHKAAREVKLVLIGP